MCFSAPASFAAAAATGAVGIGVATTSAAARDRLLAGFPLAFAGQQAVEGVLWLRLGGTGDVASGPLVWAFLLLALIAWPVLTPALAILVEPCVARRRAMMASLAAGTVVCAYLVAMMITHPYEAFVRGGSIAYVNDVNYSPGIEALYALAVCPPLLLSSHRRVVLFGVAVLGGAVVAYFAFSFARVSVWCFFAGAASLALIGWPPGGRRIISLSP